VHETGRWREVCCFQSVRLLTSSSTREHNILKLELILMQSGTGGPRATALNDQLWGTGGQVKQVKVNVFIQRSFL